MSDKPGKARYARPDGTRSALRNAIRVLRDIAENIHMPGDFKVKAENLCVDMQNEESRTE